MYQVANVWRRQCGPIRWPRAGPLDPSVLYEAGQDQLDAAAGKPSALRRRPDIIAHHLEPYQVKDLRRNGHLAFAGLTVHLEPAILQVRHLEPCNLAKP